MAPISEQILALHDQLVTEHDAHMANAYERWLSGEEPGELFAYGAGLQRSIRLFQELLGRM